MVRYINTRDSADPAKNGQSFRVGETVFVVAAPAVPRAQHGRPAGLSLTSLTITLPEQDDADVAPHANGNGHGNVAPINERTRFDSDGDDSEADSDDDERDAAQVKGTELLAPLPASPASTGSLERRLASILPGNPDPADVGLISAPPTGLGAANERDERPSRGRAVALVMILLLLLGSIALMIHYQRNTQRELEALRTSLHNQQQDSSSIVIEGVRREIRAIPIPDQKAALDQAERNAQAILQLKEVITDRTQADDGRTQQLSQVIRQELAGQKPEKPNLDEVKEPILSEIREMKDALADLRSRPAYVPPPAPAPAPAPVAAAPVSPAPAAHAPAASAPEPAPSPEASATLAHAQINVAAKPAERPSTVYLVDATGGLRDLIPETLAEVRRLVQQQDSSTEPYVLLLYSERLVRVAGLPKSRGASAETTAPVTDLGTADLAAAVKIALQPRPRILHILSDTLAGGAKLPELLKDLNREGAQIDVTQIHYRDGQEAMKRIAREHNGMYSFIPGSR